MRAVVLSAILIDMAVSGDPRAQAFRQEVQSLRTVSAAATGVSWSMF